MHHQSKYAEFLTILLTCSEFLWQLSFRIHIGSTKEPLRKVTKLSERINIIIDNEGNRRSSEKELLLLLHLMYPKLPIEGKPMK
jgi:hypothetical protein